MFRALCLTCLLALACLPLVGCGNKGALVMPDQTVKKKHHKQPPATAQTSADETSGTNH